MDNTPDLSGKVALVTGGAGGFGRAVTQILLEHGAQVALTDIDRERAEAAAKELGAVPFVLDVGDYDANVATVAAVEEAFGGIDIAFLNAGISARQAVTDEFDAEAYRRVVAINLDGVAFGTQAVVPAMRKRGGGHIVATASLAGLVSMARSPYYAMTKAGVIAYARCAGLELAPENIKMHALAPGFADTPIIDEMRADFEKADFPIIPARTVAETFLKAATSDESGLCWLIQAGVEPAPFRFRGVPAARKPDGTAYGVPKDLDPTAQAPASKGDAK